MPRTRRITRAEGVKITFPEAVHISPAAAAALHVHLQLDPDHELTQLEVEGYAQDIFEDELKRLHDAGALAAAQLAVQDAQKLNIAAQKDLELSQKELAELEKAEED